MAGYCQLKVRDNDNSEAGGKLETKLTSQPAGEGRAMGGEEKTNMQVQLASSAMFQVRVRSGATSLHISYSNTEPYK